MISELIELHNEHDAALAQLDALSTAVPGTTLYDGIYAELNSHEECAKDLKRLVNYTALENQTLLLAI